MFYKSLRLVASVLACIVLTLSLAIFRRVLFEICVSCLSRSLSLDTLRLGTKVFAFFIVSD